MTHSNKPAKNPWQFSIREFLLVLVAVGCLVTLYVNNHNFKQTAFSRSFAPNLLLNNAMKNLRISSQGGAGGGGNSGSRRVSLNYRSSYQKVPGTRQPVVLEEIYRLVEKQIVESGCEIVRIGHTGKIENDSLTEFEIEYKTRNAIGRIRVVSTIGERGDWQFWIDIFEY